MKSEWMRTAAFSSSISIHMQRLHANYANININTNYNIIFNYNIMAAAALRAASGHREKTTFYLLWNTLRGLFLHQETDQQSRAETQNDRQQNHLYHHAEEGDAQSAALQGDDGDVRQKLA